MRFHEFLIKNPKHINLLKLFCFVLCLTPFLHWVWQAYQQQLGANPTEYLQRSSGTWALVMLCATLSITPLRQIFSIPWLLKFRRMLGLFAFFYALIHALLWAGLDQGFNLGAISTDIVKRPFILMGALSFLLLLPLAITSTNGWQKRLKRNWQKLHYLIYPCIMIVLIHYWWHKTGKHDYTEVSIYAAFVVMLLAYRGWRRFHQKQ